jgi:hypothetical protein
MTIFPQTFSHLLNTMLLENIEKGLTDQYFTQKPPSTVVMMLTIGMGESECVFASLESLVIHELLFAKLITLDEFSHKKMFPSTTTNVPFSVSLFSTLFSRRRRRCCFFFPSQKAFSLNDVEILLSCTGSENGATQANMKHRTSLALLALIMK